MDYLLVLALGLVAGTLGGIVGFGTSIMLMPALVLVYGPKQAVPIMAVGSSMANASRVAAWWRDVDWRTTLLVPAPMNVAHFKQVDINGSPGVLIEMTRERPAPGQAAPVVDGAPGAQLMWSSGGSVYVLMGNVRQEELFTMAQSVQ